jgi:hypothetical protein
VEGGAGGGRSGWVAVKNYYRPTSSSQAMSRTERNGIEGLSCCPEKNNSPWKIFQIQKGKQGQRSGWRGRRGAEGRSLGGFGEARQGGGGELRQARS